MLLAVKGYLLYTILYSFNIVGFESGHVILCQLLMDCRISCILFVNAKAAEVDRKVLSSFKVACVH